MCARSEICHLLKSFAFDEFEEFLCCLGFEFFLVIDDAEAALEFVFFDLDHARLPILRSSLMAQRDTMVKP